MFISKINILMLFILFSIICITSSNVRSEYIHLKDGQIVSGIITRETSNYIFVKTRFQNRRIKRSTIRRILYGQRKMERIYIQLNDGTLINGYLVDQDALKMYIKNAPYSAKEIEISKEQIKQMSGKEIIPLSPDISFRVGLFSPLNPGGSNIGPSLIYFANTGINITILKYTRIVLEAGYTKSKSSVHDNQFMQFIPITAQGKFLFPVSFFRIVPKIGIGATIINFDSGEDPTEHGIYMNYLAGLGLEFDIINNRLSIQLGCDYNIMLKSITGSKLHSLTPFAGLIFLF